METVAMMMMVILIVDGDDDGGKTGRPGEGEGESGDKGVCLDEVDNITARLAARTACLTARTHGSGKKTYPRLQFFYTDKSVISVKFRISGV